MKLYLIGMRCVGKSTTAPLAAAALRLPWFDLDAAVESRAGRSISEIFAAEGEVGFRRRESEALASAAAGPDAVFATGGGVVLRPENRKLLAEGVCVWLRALAETMTTRMKSDARSAAARPRLCGSSIEDEVARLIEERTPIYLATADAIVDVDELTPEQAAESAVAVWRTRMGVGP